MHYWFRLLDGQGAPMLGSGSAYRFEGKRWDRTRTFKLWVEQRRKFQITAHSYTNGFEKPVFTNYGGKDETN